MSEVNAGIRQFGIDESQGTIELDRRPFRLSWTHYLTLMRIEDHVERDFYEREAIDNNWDAETLRRQYGSSLYERLLLSRDKDDVMRLANESATPQKPEDLLKAPYVLEFVGLEDKASYHESDLEQAVLDHLQDFLLEMDAFSSPRSRSLSAEKRTYGRPALSAVPEPVRQLDADSHQPS